MPESAGPRIGLFHPYPDRMGGSQQVTLALALHLPALGYHPVMVVPDEGRFTQAARAAGTEVIVCCPGPRWRVHGTEARASDWLSLGTGIQLFQYWRALCTSVRRNELALLHCMDVRGALMAAPAGRMAGRPCVWHVHSAPRGRAMRSLGAALATAAKHALFVSQGAADYWKLPGWTLAASAIVPNGLDAPVADVPARGPVPGTVLVAGSLSATKGQDVLIRAMPAVVKRFSGARCLIAGQDWGGGRFADQLQALVAGYGLQASVEFLGQRSDIPRLIAQSACVVVPSRMETFGMIALEAMALSRPVIACRTGGLPEIVEDGRTGLLVAPDDPQALAQAVIRVLEDPDFAGQLGRNGHERWLRHFTMRAMTERTARFYDRLLGKHAQTS
jgi:hypothetical protein